MRSTLRVSPMLPLTQFQCWSDRQNALPHPFKLDRRPLVPVATPPLLQLVHGVVYLALSLQVVVAFQAPAHFFSLKDTLSLRPSCVKCLSSNAKSLSQYTKKNGSEANN